MRGVSSDSRVEGPFDVTEREAVIWIHAAGDDIEADRLEAMATSQRALFVQPRQGAAHDTCLFSFVHGFFRGTLVVSAASLDLDECDPVCLGDDEIEFHPARAYIFGDDSIPLAAQIGSGFGFAPSSERNGVAMHEVDFPGPGCEGTF